MNEAYTEKCDLEIWNLKNNQMSVMNWWKEVCRTWCYMSVSIQENRNFDLFCVKIEVFNTV